MQIEKRIESGSGSSRAALAALRIPLIDRCMGNLGFETFWAIIAPGSRLDGAGGETGHPLTR
jgi:hypothetical protein